MSDRISILAIEIEGFRGFRDRQRFDLDASAVLVTGPNGTGKTSFFDAFQWLLVGSLKRLEPLRSRRNTEHIVNQWRLNEPAVVEAELAIDGKLVRLRRQGKHDGGILEWIADDGTLVGSDAVAKLTAVLGSNEVEFERSLMTSGILQQDVIRNVLTDKPADRYQQLAMLLGIDDVNLFADAARKRADRLAAEARDARAELDAAERKLRAAVEKRSAAVAKVRSDSEHEAAWSDLLSRLDKASSVLALKVDIPDTASDVLVIEQAAVRWQESIEQALRVIPELANAAAAISMPSEIEVRETQGRLARAEEDITAAMVALGKAEAALRDAKLRSDAMSSLAAQALPLLGNTCPVCEQSIDSEHVADHLRNLADAGDPGLGEATKRHHECKLTLQKAEAARQTERAVADRHTLAAQQKNRVESEREQLARKLTALVDDEAAPFAVRNRGAVALLEVKELRDLADGLDATRAVLEDARRLLQIGSVAQQVTALEADVQRAQSGEEAAREKAKRLGARDAEGKTLRDASLQAASAVTRARFESLAPLVKDIFTRLDPHPAFTTLDFELDVYNNRGVATPMVRDEAEGVVANPLIVFSSSQANVAALSYFLALGWAAGAAGLPFVFMDDPLQSMDDVNVLGFADLCRHLRRTRQVFVSTHDRRLAGLLERKLAPRLPGESTVVYEFTSWSRRGPKVEKTVVHPQLNEGSGRTVAGAA